MDGILQNLTDEQRITLKNFKLRLEDLLTPDDTDYALVKYLLIRNFDLKSAEKIFKNNYYNKITWDVNNILENYEKPEVARKYESFGVLGYAKDGTLIRYGAWGRIDFYGLIMSMSTLDLCLYFSHMFESDVKMLKDRSLETGKKVQEMTYILDLGSLILQSFMHKNVIELGFNLLSHLQDCYPEIWSKFLVINIPRFFDMLFKLFKPALGSRILETVRIADKDSTKNLLLKYIDADVLPVFLGGNRVDSRGDPECKEFISFGGKVPHRFYGQNTRIPLSPSDPEVKCYTVGPSSVCNISVRSAEANMKLRTQIRTENGSIWMSVHYKQFGPDPSADVFPGENGSLDLKYKQVTVDIRNQAHCTQEDVMVMLPIPGIYVYRFSNSSWFTSRKLLVKLDMLPA